MRQIDGQHRCLQVITMLMDNIGLYEGLQTLEGYVRRAF